MRRMGYFSIRGYWHTPLAVFAIAVFTVLALGGRQSLGLGLGAAIVFSSIMALIGSIVASRTQSVLEMMHEVDSSLQLVDYRFDVWGNQHLTLDSSRGEWKIDIPNSKWTCLTIRGPNELYRVIDNGPGFKAEITAMLGSISTAVSAK